MARRNSGKTLLIVGATVLMTVPFLIQDAFAEPAVKQTVPHPPAAAQARGVTKPHSVVRTTQAAPKSNAHPKVTTRWRGLSCVPFARAESGIIVAGNAWQWWGNAAGVYARGATPEPGSVLVFRANGRMRLGHVAVVARVVNAREVLIDHANWPSAGYGGVSQAIPVVDVSENNDWTAVRVGLGREGNFGSVYPTYGYIYDRPDTGTIEANRGAPAEQVAELNPPPHDLRQTAQRPARNDVEVAQLPKHPRKHTVAAVKVRKPVAQQGG